MNNSNTSKMRLYIIAARNTGLNVVSSSEGFNENEQLCSSRGDIRAAIAPLFNLFVKLVNHFHRNHCHR